MFWAAVLHRYPGAMFFTKVKGHATQEIVESGLVSEENKKGNDLVDMCADERVGCGRKRY